MVNDKSELLKQLNKLLSKGSRKEKSYATAVTKSVLIWLIRVHTPTV
jgi:hypothetical protein